jgi:hypothetical protein
MYAVERSDNPDLAMLGKRQRSDFIIPGLYDPAQIRRARRRRLFVFVAVFLAAAFLVCIVVVFIERFIADGGLDADRALRRASLASHEIVPLGRDREEAFMVPLPGRATFEKGFNELLQQRTMIIHCRYRLDPNQAGFYHYWFWHRAVPDTAYTLFRLVGHSHAIRNLGAGAVSACPLLLGEAWDKSKEFQALLPPAHVRQAP